MHGCMHGWLIAHCVRSKVEALKLKGKPADDTEHTDLKTGWLRNLNINVAESDRALAVDSARSSLKEPEDESTDEDGAGWSTPRIEFPA